MLLLLFLSLPLLLSPLLLSFSPAKLPVRLVLSARAAPMASWSPAL
jgi:hypothetical protein